jgi:hypothetical protein
MTPDADHPDEPCNGPNAIDPEPAETLNRAQIRPRFEDFRAVFPEKYEPLEHLAK